MVRGLLAGIAVLAVLSAILPHTPRVMDGQPGGPVPSVSPSPTGDCHATVVATDGTPPQGAPQFENSGQLCDALHQAETTAACMGDWQPPNPDRVNARQMCLEVKRRGCGDPQRDCTLIPEDTYYYHH